MRPGGVLGCFFQFHRLTGERVQFVGSHAAQRVDREDLHVSLSVVGFARARWVSCL